MLKTKLAVASGVLIAMLTIGVAVAEACGGGKSGGKNDGGRGGHYRHRRQHECGKNRNCDITKTVTPKPSKTPCKTPTEPEVTPTQPEVTPTQPEVTPSPPDS